jgi:hypothetical protein
MDDVCASRVLMMDNAGNRKEHQMVPRDDLIISMDRSQAMKEFVNHTEKIRKKILSDNSIQRMQNLTFIISWFNRWQC